MALVPAVWHPDVQGGRRRPDLRLIGLELRIADSTGVREELQVVPLEIVIPGELRGRYSEFWLPWTLHTSEGDVSFEIHDYVRFR